MPKSRSSSFKNATETAGSFVSTLVLVQLANTLLQFYQTNINLLGLGIRPLNPQGLVGIVFSPLLHGSWLHLLANAIPLLVLITLLFWDHRYKPRLTLTTIWLVSGLGTWLIGRPDSVHVGASSIIYGLVAYLLLAGILMRSWRAFFIALLVGLAFSGIWYGMLPQDGPVSWEGHLCGAIAGLIAAWRQH